MHAFSIKNMRHGGGQGAVAAFAAGEDGAGTTCCCGHRSARHHPAGAVTGLAEQAVAGDARRSTNRSTGEPFGKAPARGHCECTADDAVNGTFYRREGGFSGSRCRLAEGGHLLADPIQNSPDVVEYSHLREADPDGFHDSRERAASRPCTCTGERH